MIIKYFRFKVWAALAISLWSFIVVPVCGGVFAAQRASETTHTSTSFFQNNSAQPSPKTSEGAPADATGTWLAGAAQNAGSMLSQNTSLTDQAKDQARSMASGAASAEIERWLSGVGNARVRLGVDKNFTLKNSEFDLLVPWYQNPEWVVFTQQSVHRTDDRTQLNLGAGVRHFGAEWMTGVNAFYDYDLTRYHQRAGLGAELWRDYLKLGANGYFRLSGWRDAPELNNDYEARPANGWDVRAEGWLPAYPQVGGKLTYEQYYGKEVALQGSGNRQKDPHAVTTGVNWTPVPLVTLSGERSMGGGNSNESRFGLQLNWTPGLSLSQHLDPDAVRERRTLAGSRLDLVERNNNIVLEYRKKELLTLKLFSRTEGGGGESHPLVASLKTKYPLQGITWTATEFLQAGGQFTGTGTGTRVTLPAYRYSADPVQAAKLNTYLITGVAGDTQGNLSPLADGVVIVTEAGIHISSLATTSGALADGKDTDTVTAEVRDAGGNPVPGQVVVFTLPAGVTPAGVARQQSLSVTTDDSGHAMLALSSMAAGVYLISASLGKGPAVSAALEFISPGSLDSLVVVSDNAIADGSAVNSVKATVVGSNGTPVAGQTVTFTADNGATVAGTGTTEADGTVTMPVTSLTTGSSTVTASLNGSTKSVTVTFLTGAPDTTRSTLTASPDTSVPADGISSSTVTLTLKDAGNHPVTGQTVVFSSSLAGTLLSAVAETSAGSGIYTATLTSTAVGTATITATADGTALNGLSATVDFTADAATAKVSDLVVVTTGAVANGSSTNSVKATVRDAYGNVLANQTVSFTADNGATIAGTGTTGSDGTVLMTLTSLTAGSSSVTATVNGSSKSVTVDFLADAPDVGHSALTANPASVVADGVTTSTLTLSLKDANDNPVTGATVAFSSTLGTVGSAPETAPGVYTATLTSTTTAGTATVTASEGGRPLNGLTATVDFTADAATAEVSDLAVVTTDAVADGSSTNSVKATVTDAHGNVLANQAVSFTADNGATIAATSTTGSDGTVLMTLTSLTAGNSNVTATVNGSSKSVTVAFLADAATAEVSDLVVVTTGAAANGSSTNSVKATVTDARGNALANQTVSFTADNGATIAATGTTGSDGTVLMTLTSRTTGNSNVSATINGSSKSVAVAFVQIQPQGTITVNPATIVGNNLDTAAVTLQLTDQDNVPLPGQTVAFTATYSGIVFSLVVDKGNGTYTTTLKSTGVPSSGQTSISAIVNGSPINTSSTVTVTTPPIGFTMKAITSKNNYTFGANSGFPGTGFTGATFTVQASMNSTAYNWTVQTPSGGQVSWLTLTQNGDVTFNSKPSSANSSVQILATPKSGGNPEGYQFTLSSWFFNSGAGTFTGAFNFCRNNGANIPLVPSLTSARGTGSNGFRGIGTLWGEWGDLTSYNTSGFTSNYPYWTVDIGSSGNNYVFFAVNGSLDEYPVTNSSANTICQSGI